MRLWITFNISSFTCVRNASFTPDNPVWITLSNTYVKHYFNMSAPHYKSYEDGHVDGDTNDALLSPQRSVACSHGTVWVHPARLQAPSATESLCAWTAPRGWLVALVSTRPCASHFDANIDILPPVILPPPSCSFADPEIAAYSPPSIPVFESNLYTPAGSVFTSRPYHGIVVVTRQLRKNGRIPNPEIFTKCILPGIEPGGLAQGVPISVHCTVTNDPDSDIIFLANSANLYDTAAAGTLFINTLGGPIVERFADLLMTHHMYGVGGTYPEATGQAILTALPRLYLHNEDCGLTVDIADLVPQSSSLIDGAPFAFLVNPPLAFHWPQEGYPLLRRFPSSGQCLGGENAAGVCSAPLECPLSACSAPILPFVCIGGPNAGMPCSNNECPYGSQCYLENGTYPTSGTYFKALLQGCYETPPAITCTIPACNQ